MLSLEVAHTLNEMRVFGVKESLPSRMRALARRISFFLSEYIFREGNFASCLYEFIRHNALHNKHYPKCCNYITYTCHKPISYGNYIS